MTNDLVRRLHDEAARLNCKSFGNSFDAQDAGISATLAEEAADTIDNLRQQIAEKEVDAARWRHLRDHHYYHYDEDFVNPQPREFGIQFQHQDTTPDRPCIEFLIDEEIKKSSEEDD